MAAGLTQTELGKRINCSRTAVSHIEQGKNGVTLNRMLDWIAVCRGSLDIGMPDEQDLLTLFRRALKKADDRTRRIWALEFKIVAEE